MCQSARVICAAALATLVVQRHSGAELVRHHAYPHGLRPGPERSFQVRPQIIAKGERAVLSWFKPDASEVLLEQAAEGEGSVPPERLHVVGRLPSIGSLDVWPQITTTYVVSCLDTTHPCAESISIIVR